MRLSLLACASMLAYTIASPAAIKPESDVEKSEVKNTEDENTSEAQDDSANPEVQLPEPLTMETFDDFTSQHITFVEFFSPYCHHCQALAPKWEQAFRETYEQQ